MSEREKTNKQNQVDQLNRGLLNMLDGTANPAGRTQTKGSVDKESDIFDDISLQYLHFEGSELV